MRLFLPLSIMSLGLLLSQCAKETFKYQYAENGCDTGEHDFASLEEYCRGLRDEDLNRGCAPGLRQSAYQNRCSK